MRENTDKEEKIIEEQIQRNCEEIQKLINQKPKSSISVLRTGIDKCQIREKRTRKVLYEEKTEESFIKLKEMLSTVSRCTSKNCERNSTFRGAKWWGK